MHAALKVSEGFDGQASTYTSITTSTGAIMDIPRAIQLGQDVKKVKLQRKAVEPSVQAPQSERQLSQKTSFLQTSVIYSHG